MIDRLNRGSLLMNSKKASSCGGATAAIVDRVRGYRTDSMPCEVILVAKECLLDWLGVALAGSREPISRILLEEVLENGGGAQATVIGTGPKVTAQQACLVNGAAGHALDYDDVLEMMLGHPSAPVLPTVLAVGERQHVSGSQVLAAVVAGVETEAALGRMVEPGHHEAGWHTTGTLGTFGATAAACHLLDLDRDAWLRAFGIAATQAAGLKSVFGTMGKPFQVGRAAANGVLSANLAYRGMACTMDVIEVARGFADVATSTFVADALDSVGEGDLAISHVLFKRHASCYLTHSAIEGLLRLRASPGLGLDDITEVRLRVLPVHLGTCAIEHARTPLEAKFSLAFTSAIALVVGRVGEGEFTEEVINDPRVVSLARRVRLDVSERLDMNQMTTPVEVALHSGEVLRSAVDVGEPTGISSLPEQWSQLEDKFAQLATPVLGETQAGEVVAMVAAFEHLGDVCDMARLLVSPRPPG